eukprot:gb/GECH01003422.1/.p1 GENE.gb/GECH01003422.1/~~gb/GECH01003422.1/.p1  ORF type:complete len:262 (+),score=47.42 gb/GECH01003422.1/:1-786(+)
MENMSSGSHDSESSSSYLNQLCSNCINEVDWIKKEFNRFSESELETIFHDDLCPQLPEPRQIKFCQAWITSYSSDIIPFLKENIDDYSAETMCQVVSVCPDDNRGSDGKEEELECNLCELAINKSKQFVNNNTEHEIERHLHNICSVFPDRQKKFCNEWVNSYSSSIVQFLKDNLNEYSTDIICQMIGACPTDDSSEQEKEQELECELCDFVIGSSKHFINTSSEREIEHHLHNICNAMPDLQKTFCNEWVNTYTAGIVNF